jgi:zinc finger protein
LDILKSFSYPLNTNLPAIFLKQTHLIANMSEIKDQECPFCGDKKAILREEDIEIPFFGRVYVLSMECEACGTRKSDVEPVESKEPCKYTLEVESEDDLNIKIVKSGQATVKIPRIITMESGPASNGYVTNVEGLLERAKKIIQSAAESEDDPAAKKKAKNLIKKLNKILVGREKIKISIEDPSGHSCIVSDKAVKGKL